MIINSKFKPAKYLRNGHLQSMWPTFLTHRTPTLKTERERISLPDGDFMDLEWYGSQPKGAPIVLLMHGVTGNVNAPYIKYLMPLLSGLGYRPVMMYYRGYSGEHNRLNVMTHAGKTDDISVLLEFLTHREPNTRIAAIGFSQGANMLLKYLGEHQVNTPLVCAIAVSPPFQLRSISNRIRSGKRRFYQWYLLRTLRKFYREKFAYRQAPFDLSLLNKCYSFWQFDDQITAPVNGFDNAVDYYRQASCINYLKDITIPTLIIHAKDDTIMTPDIIPYPEQLSENTILELSEHGGHLGFVSGTLFKPKFWLKERIPVYLKHFLPIKEHAHES
jgi:predicted alpha/beta-fold hydrolase